MKDRSLKAQLSRKCVHFNGVQHKTCEAGVTYDELDAGKRVPYRAALPCFRKEPGGVDQCHCDKLRFPTDEEVQAAETMWQKEMEKMNLALAVIDPIRKEQKGKNWRGVIECPVCKGRLHVSHAACNGHVHARCETPDCVAWME